MYWPNTTTLALFFSGLAGLAHLICSKRQNLVREYPCEIWLAWISAVPFLLFSLVGKDLFLKTSGQNLMKI